jgi:hypothetical protein
LLFREFLADAGVAWLGRQETVTQSGAKCLTSITDEELRFTNPRKPAGITLGLVFKREVKPR